MLHVLRDKIVIQILNFIVKVNVVYIFRNFKSWFISTFLPLWLKRRYFLNTWRCGSASFSFMNIWHHKASFSIWTRDSEDLLALILHNFVLFRNIQSFHLLNPASIHDFFCLSSRLFRSLFVFNVLLYLF